MSIYNREYTMINKYKNIYKSSKLVDFQCRVKDKVFKVHKFVLAVQNSYFCDLICAQPQLDTFEATNVDPTAFEIFLKFLYTGRVQTSVINEELLLVAHQYAANELKDICDNKLSLEIDKNNALSILILAVDCNCQEMKDRACKIIAENYKELLSSTDFKQILTNEEAILGILNELDKLKEKLDESLEKETDTMKPEDFENLLKSTNFENLKIKIGNDMIPVHRNIISSESMKHEQSFTEDSSNTIELSKGLENLKLFLKHINEQKMNAVEFCMLLSILADKYHGSELETCCKNQLREKIKPENYVELVKIALDNDYELLLHECAKYYVENFYDVVNNEYIEAMIHKEFTFTQSVLWEFRRVVEDEQMKLDDLKNFYGEFIIQLPKKGYSYSHIFFVGYVPWRIKAWIHDNCMLCLEPEVECNSGVVYSFKTEMMLVSFKKEKTALDLSTHELMKLECKNGFYVLQWTDLYNPEAEFVRDGQIKVEINLIIENVLTKEKSV